MFPNKLKKGDTVRVIAPSRSLAIIGKDTQKIADKRFADLGLVLTFGKHINECDDFSSSSIASRIEDLHEAFSDKQVKAVITVIGGFNSNQLFRYVDWDLLRNNPKIFCGYSDITALNNAIYAKTGLVTYSGPHYSTFGQKLNFDYTLEYFKRCFFSDEAYKIDPSPFWMDDQWWVSQDKRETVGNKGFYVINRGRAEGVLLGANLCTFNLLQGTEYMPNLENSVLFVEDDYESAPHTFDRDLQSLIHLPGFSGVKGVVIGRFQKGSNLSRDLLTKIIKTKKELDSIPVVADVDFGHTEPKITFPIGGTVSVDLTGATPEINLIKH
ncbi:LD-carboxypeptidase [Candidatus Roizmanbacteria bacterium]|nr:LD-carboxypeptidase [Candidatus Roizmanbacteria bacterium]